MLIGSELPARELAELASRLPVVVVARRVRGVDAVRSDDVVGRGDWPSIIWSDSGIAGSLYLDGGRAPGAAERRTWLPAASHAALDCRESIPPGGLTEREGAAAAAVDARDRESCPPRSSRSTTDARSASWTCSSESGMLCAAADVSVIGFDDSPLAGLAHIDLTTVRQDTAGLAAAAVERLVARLDGARAGRATSTSVREPTLVVRGSTAPPRVLSCTDLPQHMTCSPNVRTKS